jgi:hypothetical protein
MKIQIGTVKLDKVEKQEILPNKTRRFLLPCLKEYGQEFLFRMNNVFKVAAGIGDMIIENNGVNKYEQHIFVLLDSTIASKYFEEFIIWIKEHHSYEDDYVFGDIQKSNLHMVVLRIPDKYQPSLEHFKRGKYSKMFSKDTIDTYFQATNSDRMILIRDHSYKIAFTRRVNKLFNMTGEYRLKPEDWEPDEYELPPTREDEIFNHHIKPKK